MALNNFIAQVWSARVLENTRKSLVYGQDGVINHDYEGDASMGNTVRINSIGAITVGDYAKNANMSDPQELTDAQLALLIDRAKFFNFQVDDIDKVQQNPKMMDAAMEESGYALADEEDQYIAGLYTEIPSANIIGSDSVPIVLSTAAAAYEYLVALGVKLTNSRAPKQGRWVIVPPWFSGLLLKDDRFVKAGTAQSDATLRNGEVGQAAGFRILESLNVPNISGAKYKIQAGHPKATTVASQIEKVEKYRMEKRFADAVKGLHVYGVKVVRPEFRAMLVASES